MRSLLVVLVLVWPSVVLAQASAKDTKELRALVDKQIKWIANWDEDEATKLFAGSDFWSDDVTSDEVGKAETALGGPDADKHKVSSFTATVSRDGKTAWLSFFLKVRRIVSRDMSHDENFRITQVATKDDKGWRIVAGMTSQGQPNAAVNKAAKEGKAPTFKPMKGGSDAGVQAAVEKLIKGPLDAEALARKDLVAIGSGPNERTLGGAKLGKPWASGWANKVTIEGPVIAKQVNDSGYAVANLTLEKPGKTPYKIPFRVFLVFDKDKAGAFSLAHVHFSVAPPP